MNWRVVSAVTRKDLVEVLGNKMAWMPALVLPLILAGFLPAALIAVATYAPISGQDMMRDLNAMGLFSVLKADLSGLDLRQTWIVLMVGHFFAPLFLMLPLMTATIVGADSFVGERERKTLEPLIYAPATDTELLTGKVLASFLPSLVLTWGAFLLYVLVANGVGWRAMGHLWFPLPNWYPLVFWITPALSLLGTAAAVLVSTRAKTFMEAYQSSGIVVLLPLAFLAGQATGVMYLAPIVGMLAGLVVWVLAVLLMRLAVRTFRRSELIARV
ncbi:MAG TPA: ABC transporter permease subunit [Deinococcales bacterium]|nr:ABC transporter permease subunit [Deinococcales bacterium]